MSLPAQQSSKQAVPPSQYIFKIIILGDANVGKSSLALRYATNYFGEPILTTLCVDFQVKTLHFPGVIAKLRIWETAGQERFGSIGQAFYRGTDSIVLAFDLTNMDSFKNVGNWLKDAKDHTSDQCLFLLVGTKLDLVDKRAVPQEMAQNYAETIGARYIETSAKTSENLEAAFQPLAETLVKQRQQSDLLNQGDRSKDTVNIRAKNYDRSWCFGGDGCSTI